MISMNQSNLISQIEALIELVTAKKKSTRKRHEKLRIALSGILRLIAGQQSTLTRVSGKPKDLRKYAIELADELEKENLNDLKDICHDLQDVLTTARNKEYRME